ncbi:MAG: SurA N-terminal domain-containing protein [Muribaculaceae bacterium]|nr:SurA N-terminal domain-containing protein [Muribaculaceae bacterium]
MATLEKIRSKSVLLFTVIIVALLAFILGDFFNSGRSLFGGGTTVAEIGEHEIDVQLYQQRLNLVNQQLQEQGKETDFDMVQTQVLQEMLFEKMMNAELDKVGIVVTNKELGDIITKNPQTAQIIDAIKNPGKYNIPAEYAEQLKGQLANLETESENQIKQFIYGYLFNGLFTANELDAKQAYDAINKNYHVSFTSKELASLPDDEFQVSDAEIKAEWNKNKEKYALENEMRTIKYFTVLLNPSVEDNMAAENAVNTAIAGLNEKPGVEAIASDVNFNIKTKVYAPSQIKDLQLKNFVDTAKVGQAVVVSKLDKTYTIAKLLSAKNEMDSVNVSVIQMSDSLTFDSVMNAVNNGAAVKTFIAENGGKTQGADSVWIRLSEPNTDKDLKAKILNASVGQKIAIDTVANGQQIYALYVVNEKTPAVKISEVAEITYVVEPSEKTINDLTGKLDEFLANNTTLEDFATAPTAGYALNNANIDATSSHINYMPESRAAIKWAMNAKKGEISTPFSNRDNNRLLVVAVTGIYTDYITTENEELKQGLIAEIRDNKKAEAIIADFNSKGAKDLVGYMALTGDTITNARVALSNISVNTLGSYENAFIGAVTGAEKGQLIGPMKTNNAVVVAQIDDIDNIGRPYNFKEYKDHFNQMMGGNALYNNLFGIMKGSNKLESKLLDFYEN